jgi:hypothetical protein
VRVARWRAALVNDDESVVATINVSDGGGAIEFEAFYNDAINEGLQARDDYVRWREEKHFSFSAFPFVLHPAQKARILAVDATAQQRSRFRRAYLDAMFQPAPQSPYLVLKVRRDNLLTDTLNQVGIHLRCSQSFSTILTLRKQTINTVNN